MFFSPPLKKKKKTISQHGKYFLLGFLSSKHLTLYHTIPILNDPETEGF